MSGNIVTANQYNLQNATFTSNSNDVFITANNDSIFLRNAAGDAGEFLSTTGSFVFRNSSSAAMVTFNKSTQVATFAGKTTVSNNMYIGGTPNTGPDGSYRLLRLTPLSGTETQISFDLSTGSGSNQAYIYNTAGYMEIGCSTTMDFYLSNSSGRLVVNGGVVSNNTTDADYNTAAAAIKTAGGIRAAKKILAADGFTTVYGKGLALDSNWTNTKIIENEFNKSGGFTGDGTYLYSAGTGAGSGSSAIIGYNTSSVVVYPTTVATNSTSGAFQCRGGAGISGDLYVGGNVNFGGTFSGGAAVAFTPSLVTDTTVTYTTQEGYYFKVGPMVYVKITIVTTSAIYLGAGNLVVSGLPFAAASGVSQGLLTVATDNYAYPASTDTVSASIAVASTQANVTAYRDGLAPLAFTAPTTAATRTLRIGGWYMAS
jgi:hypothetical protein